MLLALIPKGHVPPSRTCQRRTCRCGFPRTRRAGHARAGCAGRGHSVDFQYTLQMLLLLWRVQLLLRQVQLTWLRPQPWRFRDDKLQLTLQVRLRSVYLCLHVYTPCDTADPICQWYFPFLFFSLAATVQ